MEAKTASTACPPKRSVLISRSSSSMASRLSSMTADATPATSSSMSFRHGRNRAGPPLQLVNYFCTSSSMTSVCGLCVIVATLSRTPTRAPEEVALAPAWSRLRLLLMGIYSLQTTRAQCTPLHPELSRPADRRTVADVVNLFASTCTAIWFRPKRTIISLGFRTNRRYPISASWRLEP